MTIEKGTDWGSRGELADDAPIAATDREIVDAYLGGATEVGLVAGDLARSVGANASADDLRRGADRVRLPIDLGEIQNDTGRFVFAAHAVLRRRGWRGDVIAIMNTPFLGGWNPAPRAHPNDGHLDVVWATLRGGQKWEARHRLASGTHIPHPDIQVRRRANGEIPETPGTKLWIDGRRIGPGIALSFRVLPDALTIVI
ncbi:MAG: hypothetical protein ACR2P0_08555 [Acidimicrobiales bacterium]